MKFISLIIFFILVMVPQVSFGATSGLVPCGNTKNVVGITTDACTFNDVIILVETVIDFLLFSLAAPIAAVMFAYAGFVYITNGGNESKIKQAHDIFLSVFWGLVIALAAWLVVNFILTFFLGTGSDYNFLS